MAKVTMKRDSIKKLQHFHPKPQVPSRLADNEDAHLGGMFDDLIANGKAKFGGNCKSLDQFNATTPLAIVLRTG
jgi:hypothetical protein